MPRYGKINLVRVVRPVKRNNEVFFRVNLEFYPEKLVRETFGDGEQAGKYMIFQGKFKIDDVYEGFTKILEGMMVDKFKQF